MISSSIKVLFHQLNFLSAEFSIQNHFIILGFIPLLLIVVILFAKKNKNKSHIKISQNQTSKRFETKSKNTFLYPEQHLGNLEQGKVYDSETFPTYYQDSSKVGEFTIIEKKK